MQPTFKTSDLDTAAAVYDCISEIPEMIQIGDRIEARFYSDQAPEAARRFRNNSPLQNFLTAKKTIYRLFLNHRQGVKND